MEYAIECGLSEHLRTQVQETEDEAAKEERKNKRAKTMRMLTSSLSTDSVMLMGETMLYKEPHELLAHIYSHSAPETSAEAHGKLMNKAIQLTIKSPTRILTTTSTGTWRFSKTWPGNGIPTYNRKLRRYTSLFGAFTESYTSDSRANATSRKNWDDTGTEADIGTSDKYYSRRNTSDI